MKSRIIILSIIIFTGCKTVHAENYVLLFGGGPNPNDSQGSIQINMEWISDILAKRYKRENINILFTDGGKAGLDVRRIPNSTNQNDTMEEDPISRVFSQYTANKYEYISSTMAGNSGMADAGTVIGTLTKMLHKASPGDDVLMVYQGHGGYDRKNPFNNSLLIWNNTSLTASTIQKTISETNSVARVRFIFPQCFSGAFLRIAFNEGEFSKGIKKNICGFVAQKETLESEGCTDSINTDEFVDYSYYFFSAISGKTITGEEINDNPDINKDSQVSLREAHLYTLANAFSIDYSSSTSEYYLLNWQPWYIKWLPVISNHNNEYDDIVAKLVARFGLNNDRRQYIPLVKEKLRMLSIQKEKLLTRIGDIEHKIEKNQSYLKSQLVFRWPIIIYSYTNLFNKTISRDNVGINEYLIKNPTYQALVHQQTEYGNMAKKLLKINREEVQLQKIIELSRLSAAKYYFDLFANEKDKQAYENLIQCEESVL